MQEKWKYIGGRDGDFPEAFLFSQNGNKIKVEINKEKKLLKIFAETPDGDILESSIANGVVIEEKDCRTGRKENLIESFTAMGKILSAIPDSKVIRLIGGNYGVMTEFLGGVSKRENSDLNLIKRIFKSIFSLPGVLFAVFIAWFSDIAEEPRISDVVDSAVIVTGGYLTYLINYNYVIGGLALITGALASGYVDWLVRKREPYVFKVLVLSIPASYAIMTGLWYQ